MAPVLFSPAGDLPAYLSQPPFPARIPRAGPFQEGGEGHAGIGVDSHLQGVVAAQHIRVDVDLDGGYSRCRDLPEMGGHAAGARTDEAHQIGPVRHPVGGAARVGADHTDGQRMGTGDGVLSVEGGHHRNGETFGQGHQLARSTGGPDPSSRHNHGPAGAVQQVQGRSHVLGVGERPHRRYGGESFVDPRVEIALLDVDLALVARELDMGRSRTARHGGSEGLPDRVGDPLHPLDGRVELGDVDEGGPIVDLLIDAPAGHRGMEASRESDYRGVGQVCVTQPGRQVERTHRLGHAHAGPARHPGVAVGHVGGRFLAMRLDALHPELL